jgi:hypothetical protein
MGFFAVPGTAGRRWATCPTGITARKLTVEMKLIEITP